MLIAFKLSQRIPQAVQIERVNCTMALKHKDCIGFRYIHKQVSMIIYNLGILT